MEPDCALGSTPELTGASLHWCPVGVNATDTSSEDCSCATQGVCSDAGSFDLTGANLGAAIQEVLAAVEVALVRRDSEGQTDAQVIFTLYQRFSATSNAVLHALKGGAGCAIGGGCQAGKNVSSRCLWCRVRTRRMAPTIM